MRRHLLKTFRNNVDKTSVELDDCDIYWESVGSREAYRQNTMTCSRNVLTKQLQTEGDWRVALAGIFIPTSIENVTTKQYFVHTEKTPFKTSASSGNKNPGGVMVEPEYWSNHTSFLDYEYKTVKDVVTRLYVAVDESTRRIVTFGTGEVCVEFNIADGRGVILHYRSLFVIL